MELRHLRAFVVVAEELHFGRAAERLHTSQPALTVQVKRLERELGAVLLARTTRRVALTDVGAVVLERARAALAAAEDVHLAARDASAGLRGRLPVGFVSSATSHLLPQTLRRYRRAHPDVELVLEELTSAEQLDALVEGRIRVGILRLPVEDPVLRVEVVCRERLVAAIPVGHRLARDGPVPMGELLDEPVVAVPRRKMPGFHASVAGLYAKHGASMQVAQYAQRQETIVGLVAGGLGVALLPESVTALRHGGVVYRPVDDPDAHTDLGVVRGHQDHTRLVRGFVQAARKVAER